VQPNNGVLSVWPNQRRAVQVTAKFGWPAVPGAIKDLTIAITRQLRDLEEGGATMALQAIDSAITMSPNLTRLMMDIERIYGKPPSIV
jgi:hypothetical protein